MDETQQGLAERADALERELREVRRRLAGLPDESLGGHALVVLEVAVGSLYCAIPVAYIDEVVPMAALLEVPASAPWIVGLLDLGGELIPVLDLPRRFASPEEGDLPLVTPKACDSIVIASAVGRRFGVWVQGVPTLREVECSSIATPPEELSTAPFCLGAIGEARSSRIVLGMVALAMTSSLPLDERHAMLAQGDNLP